MFGTHIHISMTRYVHWWSAFVKCTIRLLKIYDHSSFASCKKESLRTVPLPILCPMNFDINEEDRFRCQIHHTLWWQRRRQPGFGPLSCAATFPTWTAAVFSSYSLPNGGCSVYRCVSCLCYHVIGTRGASAEAFTVSPQPVLLVPCICRMHTISIQRVLTLTPCLKQITPRGSRNSFRLKGTVCIAFGASIPLLNTWTAHWWIWYRYLMLSYIYV